MPLAPPCFIRFHQSSKAEVYNSDLFGFIQLPDGYSDVYVENTTFNGIGPAETSHVEVVNSSFKTLELSFAQGSVVKVNDLRAGFFDYLDLKDKISSSYHAFDLKLNKTSIETLTLLVYYDSETDISNSSIESLGILIPSHTSAMIDGLKPLFYEYEQVGEMVLNKTSIAGQVSIKMEPTEDSLITVANSSVSLFLGHNCSVHVIDSVVEGLTTRDPWSFSGTIYFENVTWKEGILVFGSSFCVYGDISLQDFALVIWRSSNITRNYLIVARNMSNSPIENVTLTLLDKNSTLVWNGTTDSPGRADFNVTFADSNYTDTLRLNIFKEGFYNETKAVGFLSDTPVSIVLTEKIPGDLNLDREVSLADLVLLAQAYGSKPGDSNWNPNADIDGNNIVGLSDLVALAQHYGQHYP
jgi:cold shock CspA family protein